MSDLLKEAIADAKAVRETALANAKMALEEAFTPQLQSMLSAKLREDDDELEDLAAQDEIPGEEDPLAALTAQDEIPGEEVPGEVPGEEVPIEGDNMMYAQDGIPGEEDPLADPLAAQDEIPGEEELEGVIEINGVKYAPVVAEDDVFEDFAGQDSPPEEDPDQPAGSGAEMGEQLDLEAIIKELEAELNEDDDAYPENVDGDVNSEQPSKEMGGTSTMTEDEYTASEKNVEDDEDPEHVGDQSTGAGNTPAMGTVSEQDDDDEYEVDEAMFEQDDDEENPKDVQAELKEYKEAVRFLKDKLHEVNILNAKLLFTNKLFKEFVLDNNQKLRVVETFDRAQSTREIKLVYTTLAENFKDGRIVRKSKIKESASAKAGSTKPSEQSRKVITEEAKVADRFRLLAGIKK